MQQQQQQQQHRRFFVVPETRSGACFFLLVHHSAAVFVVLTVDPICTDNKKGVGRKWAFPDWSLKIFLIAVYQFFPKLNYCIFLIATQHTFSKLQTEQNCFFYYGRLGPSLSQTQSWSQSLSQCNLAVTRKTMI